MTEAPIWDEFWSSKEPADMTLSSEQSEGGCSTSGTTHDPVNSEHVLAATGVDRGATPAMWNAIGHPSRSGPWRGVDHESGPADLTGHATGCFETGPNRWEQTLCGRRRE